MTVEFGTVNDYLARLKAARDGPRLTERPPAIGPTQELFATTPTSGALGSRIFPSGPAQGADSVLGEEFLGQLDAGVRSEDVALAGFDRFARSQREAAVPPPLRGTIEAGRRAPQQPVPVPTPAQLRAHAARLRRESGLPERQQGGRGFLFSRGEAELESYRLDAMADAIEQKDGFGYQFLEASEAVFRGAGLAFSGTINEALAPGTLTMPSQSRFNLAEGGAAFGEFFKQGGDQSVNDFISALHDAMDAPPGVIVAGELLAAGLLPPFAVAGPLRGIEQVAFRGLRTLGRAAGGVADLARETGFRSGAILGSERGGFNLKDEARRYASLLEERGEVMVGLNLLGPLDDAAVIAPAVTVSRVTGMDTVLQVDLTRRQKLANVVAQMRPSRAGREQARDRIRADELTRPAAKAYADAGLRAESKSAIYTSETASDLSRAFILDDAGRVPALAGVDDTVLGAPNISTIAARWPRYEASLTPNQKQAMLNGKARIEETAKGMREAGEEFGERADLIEGGWYWPRGTATAEGFVEPVSRGARRGGKPGFLKPSTRSSMELGQAEGDVYPSIIETLDGFFLGAERRINIVSLTRFFRELVDPATGQRLGQTAIDRMDETLRANALASLSMIRTRNQTFVRQTARGRAQTQAAKETRDVAEGTAAQREGAFTRLDDITDVAGIPLAGDTGDIIKLIDGELRALRRAAARTGRAATRAEKRAAGTEGRRSMTDARLDTLKDERDALMRRYTAAKKAAAGAPQGQSAIPSLPGLQGTSFPNVISNAANKAMRDFGLDGGTSASWLERVNELNNLYRGLAATADNSAPFIQGFLGFTGSPAAMRDAMKVNILSWADPNVLGKFLSDFDTQAKLTGRLTSVEWAELSLRVGGSNTEFQLGQGFTKGLQKIAVIRHANRAFGNLGDSLRLGWSNDALAEELRKGRTLKDIISSGDATRIARSTNRMTGWTEGKAFGNVGDLLLFAPRFLQARFETVVNGAMGLRGLVGVRTTLDQRMARRALFRTIIMGSALTHSVNLMMGNETDTRLVVNGRFNSNFMRINAFGRDWSLFGPWDTMLRLMVSGGLATTQVAQGNLRDALGTLGGSVRAMGSGVVSMGVDLVTNEDFIGREVFGDQFPRWVLEHMSPFSLREAPEIIGGLVSGDLAQVRAAAATAVGEFWGIKSSPHGFSDTRDIVSGELYGIPFKGKFPNGEPLNSEQRKAVSDDPRVQEFVAEFGERLGTPREQTQQAFLSYEASIQTLTTGLSDEIAKGTVPDFRLRQLVSSFKQGRFQAGATAFSPPEVQEGMKREHEATVDILRQEYWLAPAPNDSFGNPDFIARDISQRGVLARARQLGIAEKDITSRRYNVSDPEVEKLIRTIDFINDEVLTDYWDIVQTSIGDDEQLRGAWAEYRGLPRTQQRAFLDEHFDVELLDENVRLQREVLREQNRLIDAVRVVYYEATPKHEANVIEFDVGGLDAVAEWLGDSLAQRM
jgi:hypothetical protein